MLDQFSIFTASGLLLWSKNWCETEEGLLERFIEDVLIEENRLNSNDGNSSEMGAYALQWSFLQDMNLVFVAIYQRIVPLLYIRELLEEVKKVCFFHFIEFLSFMCRLF